MDEFIHAIRLQLASAWRFRWWSLLAVWGTCLVGFAGVSLWPDKYEASAVVFVDVSSRLDEVIGGVAIEWDMSEQLNRVRQEMLSRGVLESVARETDLDARASTPREMSDLIGGLQQTILIEETRRRVPDPRIPTDSTLTITYSDTDRDTAVTVVQALLATFVADVIQGGQGASNAARTFLMERIADYATSLEAREQALAEFKRQNLGLLPGDEGDYFDRMQLAMEQLDTLEADLRTAVNRREALRAQLSGENPALPQGSSVVIGSNTPTATGPLGTMQSRIAALEDELDELLLRFTDQHPDVVAARQQLDRLYEQRQSELAALAAAGGSEFEGSALSTNPVYQSIQISLNEVKVEIAALESQIFEHRRRVADLREKVDVMPEVEARLAGLVRDYDQVKQIHDELVSRLEQERLGTEAVADDVNFSVIEPPTAGFDPTTPNRQLLVIAVLVVSVACGAGLAYLLSVLKPVFSNSRALREYTELPVLGSITAVRSPAQLLRSRVQHVGFFSLVLLLGFTFVLLYALRQEAAVFAQGFLA